ncbi:MAG: hypothetical protein M1820_000907 [Bogoriella megaspora]|nr:MAG: hypothetical protein M1820_000907 [Bogoriella megaspora]
MDFDRFFEMPDSHSDIISPASTVNPAEAFDNSSIINTAISDRLPLSSSFWEPLSIDNPSRHPAKPLTPPDTAMDSSNSGFALPRTGAQQLTPPYQEFHDYKPNSNVLRDALPKMSTQHFTAACEQHGQITPPDDSPDDQSATEHGSSGDASSAIPRVEDANQMTKNPRRRKADALEGHAEMEQSPKRKKRGRKPIKVEQNLENPEEDDKREKFLERNRMAASKCRQRKKEWTGRLETKARELANERSQLQAYMASLREEVLYLKGEMLKHDGCNCHKIREYFTDQVNTLSPPQHIQKLASTLPPSSDMTKKSTQNGFVGLDPATSEAGAFSFNQLSPILPEQDIKNLLAGRLTHERTT